MELLKNRILIINLFFAVLFFGCSAGTQQPQPDLSELQAYKDQIAEMEIDHAQQLQLAEDTYHTEIEGLNSKIEELTTNLETLQTQLEEYQNRPQDITEFEQEYEKLQTENKQLRELVEYERTLREQLLTKVEQDQVTISQLKNRLESN